MRELSLFTGAGGGLLGTLLLGWRPIGYVEIDDYCQRVIAQRISDGILPAAPIFTDVREFVQSGAARQYRGFTDVVTAGFPCQPFSTAGRRRGADDPRNMWPATIDTIRTIRPRYCFLENVPGLLNSGYFERILCDLTESGYSVRWRCLSAAELGANHRRNRLWIVAYTDSEHGIRWSKPQQPISATGETWNQPSGSGSDVAYSNTERLSKPKPKPRKEWASGARKRSCTPGASWWATEPDVGRVAHGVAARVERLKAIGNGQVPLVVATAWRLLTEDLEQ